MEYTIHYSIISPYSGVPGLAVQANITFHLPLMGMALTEGHVVDREKKQLTLDGSIDEDTLVQFKKEVECFAQAKTKAISLVADFINKNKTVTSENQGEHV